MTPEEKMALNGHICYEEPFDWVRQKPGLFERRLPVYLILLAIIGGGVLALVL